MKNITIYKNEKRPIILNDKISKFLIAIDKYFTDYPLIVTDGVRPFEYVVGMIYDYCKRRKIDTSKFTEFKQSANQRERIAYFKNGVFVYPWQRAYCALIATGFKMNPPTEIKLLSGENFTNETEEVKNPTSHLLGNAVDFDGNKSINQKIKIFEKLAQDKSFGIKNVFPERAQNCIHVNLI